MDGSTQSSGNLKTDDSKEWTGELKTPTKLTPEKISEQLNQYDTGEFTARVTRAIAGRRVIQSEIEERNKRNLQIMGEVGADLDLDDMDSQYVAVYEELLGRLRWQSDVVIALGRDASETQVTLTQGLDLMDTLTTNHRRLVQEVGSPPEGTSQFLEAATVWDGLAGVESRRIEDSHAIIDIVSENLKLRNDLDSLSSIALIYPDITDSVIDDAVLYPSELLLPNICISESILIGNPGSNWAF